MTTITSNLERIIISWQKQESTKEKLIAIIYYAAYPHGSQFKPSQQCNFRAIVKGNMLELEGAPELPKVVMEKLEIALRAYWHGQHGVCTTTFWEGLSDG